MILFDKVETCDHCGAQAINNKPIEHNRWCITLVHYCEDCIAPCALHGYEATVDCDKFIANETGE